MPISNQIKIRRQPFQSSSQIRIALVDDDQSIHLAVGQIIKTFALEWLVDSYLDGHQAIQHIPLALPDAVLMDITMPGMDGIDCTRKIKAQMPDLPVIMFTARSDSESLISSVIAGASGYLIKPIPALEIIGAIERALSGLPSLCLAAEQAVIRWMQTLGQQTATSWGLTRREQETMIHLCRNCSDKEIASLLGIAPGTVHVHLVKLFKKLKAHTREEAKQRFLGLGN